MDESDVLAFVVLLLVGLELLACLALVALLPVLVARKLRRRREVINSVPGFEVVPPARGDSTPAQPPLAGSTNARHPPFRPPPLASSFHGG